MPSFILDKPTSDKDTFIFIFENCADGRLKYSTKEKILPADWDSVSQRPRVRKGDMRLKALNLKICRVYDELETLRSQCDITGEAFTKARALEVILVQLGHKAPAGKITFEQACREIIKDMEEGRLMTPRKKGKYSAGTIKNYGMSLKCLLDFQREKRISLDFGAVTINTYNAFIEWCHGQNWTINYIGQHLKNWKNLMDAALDKGYSKNQIHNSREFKTLHEETYDIALTEKELETMVSVDLSERKYWNIARDWFVIGCYTGLRVSDLKRLSPDKVSGNIILLMNEKTDEKVVIPIHPVVAGIMKKWQGAFPPPMADQDMNQNIKPVAKLCKITGKELYSVTQGGKRKDYYLDRWEMVSLHTSRRTFITLSRKNGIPDSIVMKLAGIRKAATLTRYDKLKPEEAAVIAAGLPFFAGKEKQAGAG